MRQFNNVMIRRHGAECVRHHGDGNDFGARRQQLGKFLQQEIAVIINRGPFDNSTFALTMKMPWDDV